MCNTLLCEIYTAELRGARKRLSRLRKFKKWGKYGETIELELEVAKQCVSAAKAKIDELHGQGAIEAKGQFSTSEIEEH